MAISITITYRILFQETNSVAAPASCFKQAPEPPENEFEENMKLEALDPRCVTSTCIATVVAVAGPRIRLRLDGSDKLNDFWCIVDSTDIHEIGHCERYGEMLQPPLSYTRSVNKWQTFLVKQLKNAVLAPASAFKKEPATPPNNMFKVGYKLEAVDKKNPHLICCATVDVVVDELIYVVFDGWNKTSGYWCRFDSRDIFPIKWCERSGHILQPPGKQIDTNANRRKSDKNSTLNSTGPDSDALTTATPKTVHFHTKCRGGKLINSGLLPSKLTSPTHKLLAKLCLKELFTASSDPVQLSSLMNSVSGEKSAVTVSNKTYAIKIPSSNTMKESELVQYYQSICTACKACPYLVTLEAGPEQCDNCIKHEQKENEEQERIRADEQMRETKKQRTEEKRQEKRQAEKAKQEAAAAAKKQQEKEAEEERRRVLKRPSTTDFDSESSLSSTSSKASRKSSDDELLSPIAVGADITTTSTPGILNGKNLLRIGTYYVSLSISVSSSHNSAKLNASNNQRTQPQTKTPKKPTIEWSIEEVIQYITETDSALAIHADLFRKHVNSNAYIRSS